MIMTVTKDVLVEMRCSFDNSDVQVFTGLQMARVCETIGVINQKRCSSHSHLLPPVQNLQNQSQRGVLGFLHWLIHDHSGATVQNNQNGCRTAKHFGSTRFYCKTSSSHLMSFADTRLVVVLSDWLYAPLVASSSSFFCVHLYSGNYRCTYRSAGD